MTPEDEGRLLAKIDDISAKVDKISGNPDDEAMRKAKLGVMQCLHVILACVVIYVGLRVFGVLLKAAVPSAASTIKDLGIGAITVFGLM